MDRREFLNRCALTGLVLMSGCAASSEQVSWLEKDSQSIAQGLRSKRVTPLDLAESFLIENQRLNPLLNCTIEVNPKLQKEARAVELVGPLSGLPILIKDNISTGDGMSNSAGSLALKDWKPKVASSVVIRLRQAGLLIAGKANMSEWANFRSTNSSSGWSARGGQCANPHDLKRSPCGSSSGSAAAVAAGVVPLALGTETIGSIICPSSICGIVGLKPTKGLVPTDHVVPGAHYTDCVGPMTRTVTEAAQLLNVMTGSEQYHKALQSTALKGKRIGVARQIFGQDRRVDSLLEEQLLTLSKLGATIVDPVEYVTGRALGRDFHIVSLFQLKAGLNEYLAQVPAQIGISSLDDLIAFNESHSEAEALPFMGQELFKAASGLGNLKSSEYRTAVGRLGKNSDLEAVLEKQNLDGIVAPSNGPAWTIDFVNGDHFEVGCAAAPAIAGCPHITVPCGSIHKLPIGLSLFGPKNSEANLLGMAFAFEQATQARVKPQFLGKPQRASLDRD